MMPLAEYRRQRDAFALQAYRQQLDAINAVLAAMTPADAKRQLDAFAEQTRAYLATFTDGLQYDIAHKHRAADYLALKHQLAANRLELECDRDRIQRYIDTLTSPQVKPPRTTRRKSGKKTKLF